MGNKKIDKKIKSILAPTRCRVKRSVWVRFSCWSRMQNEAKSSRPSSFRFSIEILDNTATEGNHSRRLKESCREGDGNRHLTRRNPLWVPPWPLQQWSSQQRFPSSVETQLSSTSLVTADKKEQMKDCRMIDTREGGDLKLTRNCRQWRYRLEMYQASVVVIWIRGTAVPPCSRISVHYECSYLSFVQCSAAASV